MTNCASGFVIATHGGVRVFLDHCGHDPSGLVTEVYDHPQPPSGIDVSPIEVLAARDSIVNAVIGMRDGASQWLPPRVIAKASTTIC